MKVSEQVEGGDDLNREHVKTGALAGVCGVSYSARNQMKYTFIFDHFIASPCIHSWNCFLIHSLWDTIFIYFPINLLPCVTCTIA